MNMLSVSTDNAWTELAERGKTVYKSDCPYIFRDQMLAEAREEGVRLNTVMYKNSMVYVYLLNR
jgi:hypothetical protein